MKIMKKILANILIFVTVIGIVLLPTIAFVFSTLPIFYKYDNELLSNETFIKYYVLFLLFVSPLLIRFGIGLLEMFLDYFE